MPTMWPCILSESPRNSNRLFGTHCEGTSHDAQLLPALGVFTQGFCPLSATPGCLQVIKKGNGTPGKNGTSVQGGVEWEVRG
jgi:hypothetical protein